MSAFDFVVRPETFAITQLAPDARLPPALFDCAWYSVTRADGELSVVAPEHIALGGSRESGWACLQIAGTLDFSLVGVIAGIARLLADAGVSVFVVSTYATDHVLVRTHDLETAVSALTKGGHRVTRG